MLFVATYSSAARTALRNTCRNHRDATVRRFGRVALFEATGFGAFLALRLQAEYGSDVQIERIEPFNEFLAVDDDVRAAVAAYVDRESRSTPYAKFAVGTPHPDPDELRNRDV